MRISLDSIFPKPAKVIAPPTPPDDEELESLATVANEHLQAIQNRAGREPRESARVRFPRGYLLEIGRWRLALDFVRSHTVLNNVAYALMMHDVQAWLLRRTDLVSTARDMLVKACVASLGGIAEALVVDATTPPMGRRQKMHSRIDRLQQAGRIGAALGPELVWVWDMRNRQHLFELTESEFEFYAVDDHYRAEAAVAELIKSLQSPA